MKFRGSLITFEGGFAKRMKHEKQSLIWLIMIFLLAGLNGCGHGQASVAGEQDRNGNGQASAAREDLSVAGEVSSAERPIFFLGTIGEKNRIQMRLVRNGDQFSGAYSYLKFGTELSLKGSIDKAGNLILQEFDQSGAQTGLFKGKWKNDPDNALVRVEGNWSRPNGDKKVQFVLTEQHISFSGDLRLVAKQISEHNDKRKYTIDVVYPQLAGANEPGIEKFNREVSLRINSEVGEWKKGAGLQPGEKYTPEMVLSEDSLDIGYEVVLATDNLVSIIFSVADFPHGAAHGSYHGEVVNYDLKADRLLKLSDLFQPQSRYLKFISDYCIKELKAQNQKEKPEDRMLNDEGIENGAGAEEDNYRLWNINEKGLLITFDVYQVGPFAMGQQEVVIPYSALKGILKPDGPVAQLIK